MKCVRCQNVLDGDRIDYILTFHKERLCKSCTEERAKVCYMDYGHKTAPSLVVVGNNPEQIRMAERSYRRAR
jgi:hypothetical protein